MPLARRTLKRPREDERILEELIRFLGERKTPALFPPQLVLEIGKFFLGKPHCVGTLETKEAERLVINLRRFDCFTFVENVVAVASCLRSRRNSYEAFRRRLKRIRYRQGRMKGYASRLHYFSDWVHDNERKGIVRDVTADIGGRPFRKTINFMTTHRDLYPELKDVLSLQRMKSVERAISKRTLQFIPKRDLARSENRILDGDIVAVTTNAKHLDVQHVGFAARVNNRIHLLHASITEGKVVLARQTLYRYLMQNKTRSGIIVARFV